MPFIFVHSFNKNEKSCAALRSSNAKGDAMTQAILTPDNAAERRTPWWNSSEAKAVRRQKSRGSVLDWRLRFVWIQSGAASAVNNVG
jgi:hypothetical protein